MVTNQDGTARLQKFGLFGRRTFACFFQTILNPNNQFCNCMYPCKEILLHDQHGIMASRELSFYLHSPFFIGRACNELDPSQFHKYMRAGSASFLLTESSLFYLCVFFFFLLPLLHYLMYFCVIH